MKDKATKKMIRKDFIKLINGLGIEFIIEAHFTRFKTAYKADYNMFIGIDNRRMVSFRLFQEWTVLSRFADYIYSEKTRPHNGVAWYVDLCSIVFHCVHYRKVIDKKHDILKYTEQHKDSVYQDCINLFARDWLNIEYRARNGLV